MESIEGNKLSEGTIQVVFFQPKHSSWKRERIDLKNTFMIEMGIHLAEVLGS